jgi:8-oxo-dGTP diphosphatase/2-hydroxy-dATP diphosphatase
MSSKLLRKLYTLIFVTDFKNEKILLGLKKRGFGVNKWNGLGGKVEPGESIIYGAKR